MTWLQANGHAALAPRYAELMAVHYFRQSRFKTVLHCIAYLPPDTLTPEMLHLKAQSLFRTDAADQALAIYQQIIRTAPDSDFAAPAHFMIALTHLRAARPDLARPHLTAITTHYPTSPYAPRATALRQTFGD